ncbi:MAG: AbrB/MazE/SpoVT family DNA-binding domain-containing protein [Chloroflexi bacterium]|nr:AbrB/MazE/SpoVT family DNA-binding domain-containing protein [Chloroflexota bacterium]
MTTKTRTERIIRLSRRGVLTLPKPIREKYHLREGDVLTLIDLDGVLLLSPRQTRIDALADRIARELQAQGETLESMLRALRQERERHGGES